MFFYGFCANVIISKRLEGLLKHGCIKTALYVHGSSKTYQWQI